MNIQSRNLLVHSGNTITLIFETSRFDSVFIGVAFNIMFLVNGFQFDGEPTIEEFRSAYPYSVSSSIKFTTYEESCVFMDFIKQKLT